MSNPNERARDFIESIYQRIAHGDLEHKAWLSGELSAWIGPLTRILRETHARGYQTGARFVGNPGCSKCDGGGVRRVNGRDHGCACSEAMEPLKEVE